LGLLGGLFFPLILGFFEFGLREGGVGGFAGWFNKTFKVNQTRLAEARE